MPLEMSNQQVVSLCLGGTLVPVHVAATEWDVIFLPFRVLRTQLRDCSLHDVDLT